MLGVALGEYFVGRCTGGQKFMSRTFLAAGIDGAPTTDFNPFNADQQLDCAGIASPILQSAGASITQSALMKHVWGRAQDEWEVRFP